MRFYAPVPYPMTLTLTYDLDLDILKIYFLTEGEVSR